MENKFFETHKKKLQFFVLLLFVFILGGVAGENWDTSNKAKLDSLTTEFRIYRANTQELISIDNSAFSISGEIMIHFSEMLKALTEGDTNKAEEKIDKITEYTEKTQTLKEQRDKVLERLNK